jgi:hypothetical protein
MGHPLRLVEYIWEWPAANSIINNSIEMREDRIIKKAFFENARAGECVSVGNR